MVDFNTSRFPGDGDFDLADREVLAQFLHNSSVRRALREIEKEAHEQARNLLHADLTNDLHGALKVQAKVQGMFRALDALDELSKGDS